MVDMEDIEDMEAMDITVARDLLMPWLWIWWVWLSWIDSLLLMNKSSLEKTQKCRI